MDIKTLALLFRDVRHRYVAEVDRHRYVAEVDRRLVVLRKTNADIEIGTVLRAHPSSSYSPRRCQNALPGRERCTEPSSTSCSAATIADIEIDTVLRHKPSTIHLARPMRKFVNYFKVEIPRTDNYMNMIDETRPEQQAAWLERDGKHLTNAHKIANRDVQHPPTVMLASGNLFINQISRLGECWLSILPRR